MTTTPITGKAPASFARLVSVRRLAAVAAAVVATVTGGFLAVTRARSSADEGTQYQVVRVEAGAVRKTVSASGTLQPWTVVDIKSKAGGRVDALLVEAGDAVKQGQVLARIDPADTRLTVNQAQADIEAARAKERQSVSAYGLQVRQGEIGVQTAQSQVRAAEAALSAARARLKTAQQEAQAQPAKTSAVIAQAQSAYEGAVQQRRQLDASQQQERVAAQAALDQAEAALKTAEANLSRQKTLLAKGFVAQQVVDQAQESYAVSTASVASARERVRSLGAQQTAARAAADAQVAQAQAGLKSARAQSADVQSRKNAVAEAQAAVRQAEAQLAQQKDGLRQAQASLANNDIKQQDIVAARSSIARAEAALQNAQTTLEQTTVRAPSDGVVLQKYVEQGTIITSGQSMTSTGTSIVQIGDTSKMYVKVTVDETDIASVSEGQPVEVTVDAYPRVPFTGKVARIEPQAQVEQNITTVAVRVEIDNTAEAFRLLKPNMNATAVFLIDQKENAVTVPAEAVRMDDGGTYVEVATGGKPAPADTGSDAPPRPDVLVGVSVERRPVTVGLEGDNGVEVLTGLEPGEMVVTQTVASGDARSGSGGARRGASSPFGGGPGGPPPGGSGGPRPGGGGGGGGGRR